MTGGTASGNNHINIESRRRYYLEDICKLYTKRLPERRTVTAWKNAKIVIIFKKGNKKDIKSYRLKRLLSNIYKVLAKILNKAREDTRQKPAT